MAPWRARRPLKRWRYVGFYGDDLHGCVASARIGPVPLSWWAVWDRGGRTLVEDTNRRTLAMPPGAVALDAGLVQVRLAFEEGPGVETVSRHGSSYIWTRKQAPRIAGTVVVAGRTFAFDGQGIVDDSAGYHARVTRWSWSAGVGTLASGVPVAWNLVDGVHDGVPSERTVWVDGVPHEVGPVRFLDGLRGIEFAEGGTLAFTAEAVRAHRENLLLVASEYEQPFGTFTGSLPGAGELAAGHGVMERHDVRW
jgi:hypothetical protein